MKTFFIFGCGFAFAAAMWCSFLFLDSWLARRELERARARFTLDRLEGRRP